jgi:excisionase family DNA binding protein
MHVTLGEASRQSGLSKSTISRAIRDGKLSAIRSADTGSYRIEQSELQRYLDAVAVTRATAETVAMTHTATPSETAATAALEAEIAGLREVGTLLRAELADVKTDRDHWRGQAEATQRMLTDATARRPWWKRLTG